MKILTAVLASMLLFSSMAHAIVYEKPGSNRIPNRLNGLPNTSDNPLC